MEKIIFLGLVLPIFIFVLYLGGRAIMTGFSAKSTNDSNFNDDKIINDKDDAMSKKEDFDKTKNLSEELIKLNELLKSGALTQEEFEKAKKKILDN